MTDVQERSRAELPSQTELTRLVEQALDQAKAMGASEAEASASASQGLSVTVRHDEVDTLEHVRDRGLGITVYFGQRKGTATTSDYRPASIREAVSAACDIARYTSEDPAAGLPEARHLATDIPDLELYHPWHIDADAAIDAARRCEAAARAVDRRLTNSDGAEVSSHDGVQVYGNTAGFLGGYPASQHALSCVMLAAEGSAMQRDHWFSVARDAADLEDVEQVGRRAGERTVARLGARRVPTGSYPVLFDPSAARTLFGHFVGAVSGRALYRKASFLLDSVGERIFAPAVTLREQPHLPKALGSTPFDGEGVITRPRALVEDGVLQGYVLSTYSARRLGLETTGNSGGVHNLCVEPGERGFDELVGALDRGLVVTQLMGQGVNTVTGDYSRGAAGFWVEDGEIAHPVEEITIAGNLKTMFRDIAEVGKDVDVRGNIRTGSVLVGRMTVAGE